MKRSPLADDNGAAISDAGGHASEEPSDMEGLVSTVTDCIFQAQCLVNNPRRAEFKSLVTHTLLVVTYAEKLTDHSKVPLTDDQYQWGKLLNDELYLG